MDGVYMFSPFSPETVSQGAGPALLLQMILKELVEENGVLKQTTSTAMRPFEWAEKAGSYNKVFEHASLLPFAFPSLKKEAGLFAASLDKPCNTLIALLKPFILACKNNENLLYFLFQHQKNSAVKALLVKIAPAGIEKLKVIVAAKYRKRGFHLPLCKI